MNLLRKTWSEKNSGKRPAVFLDRDGTLVHHRDVFTSTAQIELLEKVGESLSVLQESGYLLIVITNQPNIEKGLNSVAELDEQHERLQSLLTEHGAHLDAVYACPHKYPSDCSCRKPELGLIKAAQEDFEIDMENSWFIGDTGRDMETGKRAGFKTIFVKTGEGAADSHFMTVGNYVSESLSDAAEIIKKTKG